MKENNSCLLYTKLELNLYINIIFKPVFLEKGILCESCSLGIHFFNFRGTSHKNNLMQYISLAFKIKIN